MIWAAAGTLSGLRLNTSVPVVPHFVVGLENVVIHCAPWTSPTKLAETTCASPEAVKLLETVVWFLKTPSSDDGDGPDNERHDGDHHEQFD